MRDIIEKLEELNIEKQEVKEDLADMAQEAEKDHEVQMARSDLYKAAKYSVAIHKMMKDVSEMQGIEGWVASKITKAADYLGSVKHYMEGEMMADVELAVVPVAGDMTDAMSVPQEDIEEVHEEKEDHDKLHKAIKKKLKDEGGAAGMEPLKKVAKDMDIDLTPAMLGKIDGVKKHRDGDYILEDIQEDMYNDVDKDTVVAMLKKHPEEAKKMMQAGDVFSIYGKDLYNELFDYMATESGIYMGGSDVDPVNEINDMLDRLGLLDLPNDAMGYGEDVTEEPMNPNFMKQMTKSQAQQNTKSQQDMINSIIAKLPRDDADKGVDGPSSMPSTPPTAKSPNIPMQMRQRIANNTGKDPYGADQTVSLDKEFSKQVAKTNAQNMKNVKKPMTQSKFGMWSKN